MSCEYTTAFFVSNDTYASCVPSGDQAGEMIGSLAVGVGHPQRVALGGLRHIRDAGREHALLAGELFVDVVRDAVRHEAHVGFDDGVRLTAEVLPTHGVPQLEAHIDASVGQLAQAAGHQRVCTAATPILRHRAGGFVERRVAHVDPAELTAALQVGTHDRGDLLGPSRLPAEGCDRDRELGGAHAGNIDPELRQRGARGQCGGHGEKATTGPVAHWVSCILPSR